MIKYCIHSIVFSLLACAPFYPGGGVKWRHIEDYSSSRMPHLSHPLSSEQQKHVASKMRGVAQGLANYFGAMYNRPPKGYERPREGYFMVEFEIGTDGSARSVSIVEKSHPYPPLEERLVAMIRKSRFRRLALPEPTMVAFRFELSLNIYDLP